MGNDGENWKSVAASTWWVGLGDAVLRHFLEGTYGIFEIQMERGREERARD